jgi:TPR repeat protein
MASDGNAVAFEHLTALAEAGNADAQLNLGWLYDDGWVVPQNSPFAVQMFTRAAEQGLADAQFWVGWMYDIGEGVRKDSATAVTWFRKSADQGDRDAQHNLGLKYRDGNGAFKGSRRRLCVAQSGRVPRRTIRGEIAERFVRIDDAGPVRRGPETRSGVEREEVIRALISQHGGFLAAT